MRDNPGDNLDLYKDLMLKNGLLYDLYWALS